MYTLVFRGELINGHTKAEVIAKLAVLLKQPPERIEQLLFATHAGVVQPREIKRVATEAQAQQWQAAFAKAGAVLTVQGETAIEPAPLANEPPAISGTTPSDVPAHSAESTLAVSDPAPRRNRRNWMLGLVACCLVLVVSAAIVWQQGYLNRWLFASVSEEEKTLFAAMADPQLLAIARVDIELMRTLDPSMANAGQLQNLPGMDADLWSSLERSGIHIQQQATQLYAVAFATDEMEVALIARGNFSPEKITRWLDEQYGIDKQDGDGIWFAPLDKTTCTKGELILVQFTQGQLLIGSPAAVKRIALRLNNRAVAAVDLTQWQNSLGGKLFSLAVFSPARWQADKSGMVQYALAKLAAKMGPVSEVYFDLEADIVTQGVKANLSLRSDDPHYIVDTYTTVQTGLSETRQQIAQDWPEVVAIYDRLSLSHSEDQLRASIRFDHNIKDEVANWLRSLFNFSGSLQSTAVTQEEILDEQPAHFGAATVAQIRPFSARDTFMDGALNTVAGPFGLGIESLSLKDEQLEIKVTAKAYDLPNLGDESSAAFLTITEVLDHQGQSLISAPACGEADQREPEAIQHSYATSRFEGDQLVHGRALSGTKTIQLPKGVTFSQVAQIKGYLDYHLPTQIETKRVAAPLAGKVVDVDGVRVRFKSTSANGLSFEYSGNTQQLLQVNALNPAGKTLSSRSAMRGEVMFGSGRSANIDFQGTIAQAEVVLAKAITTQRYDFAFTRLAPADKAFFMDKAFPEAFTEQHFQQLKAAPAPVINEFPFYPPKFSLSVAPAVLAINDLRTSESFGLTLDGAVYTDINVPLYGNLGLAQLHVSQVLDAAAQEHNVNQSVPLFFERQGGITLNGVYQPDEKTPWQRSDFSLKARDLALESLTLVRGELRFFQPGATRKEPVPFVLGTVWSGVKSSLVLSKWEAGRLVFTVQGVFEEITGLKAFNREGELISQPPQYAMGFGEPELVLDISEQPAQLEIEAALGGELMRVPFELKPPVN